MSRRAWWTLAAVVAVLGAGGITRLGSHTGRSPRYASAADASYCALVKSYKGSLGQLPVAGGTDQLVLATALIEQAKDSAPPAIKADMEVFASAYSQVASALAAIADRPGATGPDLVDPVQTPDIEAALRHIADFDRRICAVG